MSETRREQWRTLLGVSGGRDDASIWCDRLAAAYGEPHRHYHTLRHIDECLAELDQVRPVARQPIASEWALWFHDAVYDPKASDNEEKSAALAHQCLRDQAIGGPLADEVTRLILATKHTEATTDADAALVVDIDLSILGRDEARFSEYEEQIRREYAWVPWELYAAKRVELLRHFLKRERLFQSDWFYDRYETQARRNLAASIGALSRG
jgi:predicted metal-dependent HD superfamily phosphohydrolase